MMRAREHDLLGYFDASGSVHAPPRSSSVR